jgi:hypothetical protein
LEGWYYVGYGEDPSKSVGRLCPLESFHAVENAVEVETHASGEQEAERICLGMLLSISIDVSISCDVKPS